MVLINNSFISCVSKKDGLIFIQSDKKLMDNSNNKQVSNYSEINVIINKTYFKNNTSLDSSPLIKSININPFISDSIFDINDNIGF